MLVLLAALGWALGNLSSRLAKPANPLHLTLWMSVVVPSSDARALPGPGGADRDRRLAGTSLTAEAVPAWIGLAYTVLIGTVVGSGVWTWLWPAPGRRRGAVLDAGAGGGHGHRRRGALGEIPSVLEGVGGVVVVTGVLVGALNHKARGRAEGLATGPASYRSRLRSWAP